MERENWITIAHGNDKVVVAKTSHEVDWSIERSSRPFANTTSVRVSYRCARVLVTKK